MTAFLLKSYVRTHPITLLLTILRERIHRPSPHLKSWRERPLIPPKSMAMDELSEIFFYFSLFHQRADDEARSRFLQTFLFLVAPPILVKSMFLSFRSSLTLSIQVFLCLPLLLFPSTCPCKA